MYLKIRATERQREIHMLIQTCNQWGFQVSAWKEELQVFHNDGNNPPNGTICCRLPGYISWTLVCKQSS